MSSEKTPYLKMNRWIYTDEVLYREVNDNFSTLDANAQQTEKSIESLTEVVNQKIYYFNTVADMKASTILQVGDTAITLGYYSVDDGGGATYKITTEVADNYFILSLANNLRASLVIQNNVVSIKQLGGRPQDANGKYDNKLYVEAYITKLENLTDKTGRFKLYIPSGIWNFSPTIIHRWNGFSIIGDLNFSHRAISNEATIINALNDNQDFIWQIGTGNLVMYNFELGNFTFSAADYYFTDTVYRVNREYNIVQSALKLCATAFGFVRPILFRDIIGQALNITTSWEITFDKLLFRNVGNFVKPVMEFSPVLPNIEWPNKSNLVFHGLDFEGCGGHLLQWSPESWYLNCLIEAIVVEPSFPYFVDSEGDFNDGIYNDATATHLSILKFCGNFSGNHIGPILVNNLAYGYATFGGTTTQYVYDTIVDTNEADGYFMNLNIEGVSIHGLGKNYNVIYHKEGNKQPASMSKFSIGYINNEYRDYRGIVNVYRFPNVTIGNMDYANLNYLGDGYLAPNMVAFQDIAYVLRPDEMWPGKLTYDVDTLNKLNLAVQPVKYAGEFGSPYDKVARFLNDKSKTISIRVKSGVGIVTGLTLHGTVDGVATTHEVEITGTGNYEWVDILNPNIFDDNIYVEITSFTDQDVWLDVLKYSSYVPPVEPPTTA